MKNREGWWRKLSNGFLLVLSGPSGSGKGTVSKELMSRRDDIVFSVSATTRKARESEEDGVNYFFLEEDEFIRMEDKYKI